MIQSKTENAKLIINDSLLLGKGHHKAVYIHPDKPGLCIKIPYKTPDYDLNRELAYRKIRIWRNLPSSLLTEYHGTVNTNLGIGYVFERVLDYNGNPSISLENLFSTERLNSEMKLFITNQLQQLYLNELKEEIITSDTNPDNFYLQQIAPDKFRIRIIDNIGSPAFIPLAYFVPILAHRHVKKYWRRFLKEIDRKHPNIKLNI